MGLEAPLIGALLFALLILLILFHFPIGIALGATGVIGVGVLAGWAPAMQLLATEPAGALSNKELALLPLFILMGTFAGAAGLSADLYRL
ncbi:MAG: TRAP transporter large permease subunit, partial [Bauldia litoralis]